jgi:hypothetical protein
LTVLISQADSLFNLPDNEPGTDLVAGLAEDDVFMEYFWKAGSASKRCT